MSWQGMDVGAFFSHICELCLGYIIGPTVFFKKFSEESFLPKVMRLMRIGIRFGYNVGISGSF